MSTRNVVEAVMALMSGDPVSDRDLYKRGKQPTRATASESEKLIFRNLMLDDEDAKIADILLAFFIAVRRLVFVYFNFGRYNHSDGYIYVRI